MSNELSETRGQPSAGRGRGPAFWVVTILACFFFVCTVTLFVFATALLTFSRALSPVEAGKEKKFTETVIEGTGEKKILVMPIAGIISDGDSDGLFYGTQGIVETVRRELEQAG
ncbi:MAG TPA: hypothetical protein VI387_06360, partial [Candidatus Brocadiales bacterium]|nr:hypothetical protein [Candidatus Brocadiales bacterium]